MKEEKSCGAIIYTYCSGERVFLLDQHRNGGHWSFIKGHVEGNETEVQTALREIREETGLEVTLDTEFTIKNHYHPLPGINKEVVYFISSSNSLKVEPQKEEVLDLKWFPYSRAIAQLTYDNDKKILEQAEAYIIQQGL